MKPLDLLVTGGAGYIGSHMAQMLRRAGHRVTVLDSLVRGHADAVLGAELLQVDLTDRPATLNALAGRRFDGVLHFAAFSYVGESVKEPALYYRNNVGGTINLLDAMRAAGIQRLVFSSTCATYGEPESIPIRESAPQRPVNPYGRTKWMVEHILRDYAASYGLNSVALRYFNAAGCDPGGLLGERHEPETHLIPLVLAQALRVLSGARPEATALEVFGTDFPTRDGSCVRDYVHVNDLCSAHALALDKLMEGSLSGACAFNLGNGSGFSVLEVIDVCRRVTGADIRYRVAGRRAGDPPELIGDAALARSGLGWRPEFAELETIVRTAWHWLKAHPEAAGLAA